MQPLRHDWLPYDVIIMGVQFKITIYLLFLLLVEFYLRERIIIITNDASVKEIKRHQSPTYLL